MGHIVEKDWVTKAGLRAACLFVHDSHRCGYVAIPQGHPLHGVSYSETSPHLEMSEDTELGKRGNPQKTFGGSASIVLTPATQPLAASIQAT